MQNNKTHKTYTEQTYSYRTVTVYDIRKKTVSPVLSQSGHISRAALS